MKHCRQLYLWKRTWAILAGWVTVESAVYVWYGSSRPGSFAASPHYVISLLFAVPLLVLCGVSWRFVREKLPPAVFLLLFTALNIWVSWAEYLVFGLLVILLCFARVGIFILCLFGKK